MKVNGLKDLKCTVCDIGRSTNQKLNGQKEKTWTVSLIWLEWYFMMKVEGLKGCLQTNDQPLWLKFVRSDERSNFVWPFTLRTVHFHPFVTFPLELTRFCYQYHRFFQTTNRCIQNQTTIGWIIRNRGRLNLSSFENEKNKETEKHFQLKLKLKLLVAG